MRQFSVVQAYTQGIRLFFKHIGLFAAAIGIITAIEVAMKIAKMLFINNYYQFW